MSDYESLKLAAEAATRGPWFYYGESGHEVFVATNPRLMVKAFMLNREARVEDAVFVAAANPAVILELIAENERLATRIDDLENHILEIGERD